VSAPELPLRRQVVYGLLLTVVGTLLLLALGEGLARLLSADSEDDPHLAQRGQLSFFREALVDGERNYEVAHPDAEAKGVRFRIDKAPGTLRVFVLGGSAAAGWPHPDDETFSAYLERALAHAIPDHEVEVLNVAGHGYASYRVRRIFDDVLDFEPDLLVLWSGNNEFFEVRSYRGGWLSGLRERSHLVRAVARIGALDATRRDDARARHAASTKILREPHRMRLDPEEFRGVREHYAFSMRAMAGRAAERGVPLLLATVPANLRDWAPQVSHTTLTGAAQKRWRHSYGQGRGLVLAGRPGRAIRPLEAALALEPDHADTHFLLGRAWEAVRDPERAARHYREAADQDYSPLRALSVFNDVLRSIADEHPGVRLLDLDAAFSGHADGAAPGFDLFLDYVHPNQSGNLLAARRAFDAIRREDLLGDVIRNPVFALDEAEPTYRDADDPFLQGRVFMLCLAMHQHEGVKRFGRRLLEHIEADPSLAKTRAFVRLGLSEARVRAMLEESARYVEMERRSLLGQPYDVRYRERYRDMLIEIFEAYGVVEGRG
jgi:hypothetical protein